MNNPLLIVELLTCLMLPLTVKLTAQSTQMINRYDVIISEIMADPTPAIELPAAEYLELHNRLPFRIVLTNWKIKIGNSLKTLPNVTLDSLGYALVIAEKYQTDFENICTNIIPLSSLSITDAGQTLVLYNADNVVIHCVQFKQSWHSETIKRDGGWSLEMKDEAMPCLGNVNWDSSVSPQGGTPGAPNSIRESIDDNTSPTFERITLTDSQTVRLYFSEPIQLSSMTETNLFLIDHHIDIQSVTEIPPQFMALDIHLSQALSSTCLYTLSMNGDLSDCAGNTVPKSEYALFGIPHAPQRHDLIINEVLSHPKDNADADYIEIYNRTSYIIDLKNVKIGSGGDTLPEKAVVAVAGGAQLLPGNYFVLCKNKQLTENQYYCPKPNALWQCDSLPPYSVSKGVVHLTNLSLEPIDVFTYTEDMHYPQLLTDEGVSLERIHPDGVTQDANNWHSAAATAGFGTPGYQNSQFMAAYQKEVIGISPEVFSPDNDGFQDFAEINLTFTEPENRLSITIFNAQGFAVKHLVNNELCGTEAVIRWDGNDDADERLPPGMYIVLLKWWNNNGHTSSVKKVVSIATTY